VPLCGETVALKSDSLASCEEIVAQAGAMALGASLESSVLFSRATGATPLLYIQQAAEIPVSVLLRAGVG